MAITIYKEKKQKKKSKRNYKKIKEYIIKYKFITAGILLAILIIAALSVFIAYQKNKLSKVTKPAVSQTKQEQSKAQNTPPTNQPQTTENPSTSSTTQNPETSNTTPNTTQPTTPNNNQPTPSEAEEKQKILAASNNWMIANYREKAVNLTYNIVSYSISQATVSVTGNLNMMLYLAKKEYDTWYVYSPTPP